MNCVTFPPAGFNSHVPLLKKRLDIDMFIVWLLHEEGDMVDIFLEDPDRRTRISDEDRSVMRLFHTVDINAEGTDHESLKLRLAAAPLLY